MAVWNRKQFEIPPCVVNVSDWLKAIPGLEISSLIERAQPRPSYIELLKQRIMLTKIMVSKNKQDTSHRLYLGHSTLAGNLTLVV